MPARKQQGSGKNGWGSQQAAAEALLGLVSFSQRPQSPGHGDTKDMKEAGGTSAAAAASALADLTDPSMGSMRDTQYGETYRQQFCGPPAVAPAGQAGLPLVKSTSASCAAPFELLALSAAPTAAPSQSGAGGSNVAGSGARGSKRGVGVHWKAQYQAPPVSTSSQSGGGPAQARKLVWVGASGRRGKGVIGGGNIGGRGAGQGPVGITKPSAGSLPSPPRLNGAALPGGSEQLSQPAQPPPPHILQPSQQLVQQPSQQPSQQQQVLLRPAPAEQRPLAGSKATQPVQNRGFKWVSLQPFKPPQANGSQPVMTSTATATQVAGAGAAAAQT